MTQVFNGFRYPIGIGLNNPLFHPVDEGSRLLPLHHHIVNIKAQLIFPERALKLNFQFLVWLWGKQNQSKVPLNFNLVPKLFILRQTCQNFVKKSQDRLRVNWNGLNENGNAAGPVVKEEEFETAQRSKQKLNSMKVCLHVGIFW